MKRINLSAMITEMENRVKLINNKLKAAERQQTHRQECLMKRDRQLDSFVADRRRELNDHVDALQLLYERRDGEPELITDNGMSLLEAADAGACITNLFYGVDSAP